MRPERVSKPLPTAHCSAALALLDEVIAAPTGARLLAAVTGTSGSGKSALLDELESFYHRRGSAVQRLHGSVGSAPTGTPTVLLVDDAHRLSEPAIQGIRHLLDEPEVSVVVAYRAWPLPVALAELVRQVELHRPPIVLGLLSPGEIGAFAAAALGRPLSPAAIDNIFELTGGMRWLVHHIVDAIEVAGIAALTGPTSVPAALKELMRGLEGLGVQQRELLLAIAVGFDLSRPLPEPIQAGRIDDMVGQLQSLGLLLPDGGLVPLVRRAVLESTPAYRVRALQRAMLDGVTANHREFASVARGLARSGLNDPRIAGSLERAADDALASEPALASELYDEAAAAGTDELSTAARRAQAALSAGDIDGAGRILDDLFTHEEIPDADRAVTAAAAVWAQRGMLHRSAESFRWLGPERAKTTAPLAAVAMIGVGDLAGAQGMLDAEAPSGPPVQGTIAIALMGEGILESVVGSGATALASMVRASDMMTAAGDVASLPDLPAALAALIALHSGELSVARSVLDDALAGGQGGPAARPRLLLLTAWTAMQAEAPDRARAALAEATEGTAVLAPRDELLLRTLEVGLARRSDDAAALLRAWQGARESILHVPFDLYSLMILGELTVAAARLRDTERLEGQLADAWSMLAGLGDPPLWSVPLHWSAVQAAILTERPADLPRHATALVKASGHNRLAAVFAAAGRAWIAVLASNFATDAVESAARGLASVGLPWDGSRLVGHAAARTTDKRDIARLLACARDLHPAALRVIDQEVVTASAAPSIAGRDASGLSVREREIARMVLEGKTYREIGEAIFVSPRTAEHHIAQIRRRLGATTRSDLLSQLRSALGGSNAA